LKRINVLDEETSNKIAAGEVVERPFSVVKELVENSIDAGSKNITVEIIEGGQKIIRITDDGAGIHPDDVKKAFLPHATSKILNIEDIFNINSLGFRGEALASIAAISKTKLKSKVEEVETGKEIYISGGNIEYIKDVGCNTGTIVEVSDIFFNVPARQKFLKSSQRESALISDIINRLAMANPSISFKYLSNDKKNLATYSTKDIINTINSVYGKETSENIVSFEYHNDIASVYGYIGNESISRGTRNNQSIFVNKRYIKSKLITAAVENAFKSFLTINKYPFFTLFLDIFPELIDVNIHPTKSEIKFSDERVIFKLVFDAVHTALKNSLGDKFNVSFDSEDSHALNSPTINEKILIQMPIDLDNNKIYENNSTLNKDHSIYKHEENVIVNKPFSVFDSNLINQNINGVQDIKPKFSYISVIGQYNNTYILLSAADGLYIVDQHAAHEKILFEKYSMEIKNSEVIAQILLSPLVLELTSEDIAIFIENENVFKTAGFRIDLFGNNTVNVREVPMILGKPDVKKLFLSIIDNLKNMGSGNTVEVKYHSIATIACKAAIKANDKLSDIEMKSLIEELKYINDPFTCPHGRPTIIKITIQELEKRFKRIQ
jgi:DNA mismatch repair protein MutL